MITILLDGSMADMNLKDKFTFKKNKFMLKLIFQGCIAKFRKVSYITARDDLTALNKPQDFIFKV